MFWRDQVLKAKRWLSLLLALALLLGSVSFSVAEGDEEDPVEEETVEDSGETADADEEDADVSSEEADSEEEAESSQQSLNVEATTRTPCNIRAERSLDSAKLRNLDRGKKVIIIENCDGDWCKVIYDGHNTGYALLSWLVIKGKPAAEALASVKPTSSASAKDTAAQSTSGSAGTQSTVGTASEEPGVVVPANDIAVAVTPCNIRVDRSLEAKRIHSVSKGSTVTVVEYYDDGWCKVAYSKDSYGYGRISWFKFPYKDVDDIPKDKTPSVEDDPGTPVWDTEGRGAETIKIDRPDDAEPEISGDEGLDIRQAPALPEGVSIGESDNDEMRYIAMTLKKITIYEGPSNETRRVGEIKKGKKLRVLAFGDDWCKIRTWDGQVTGYVRSRYVFHYHTMDPFKWKLPFYDTYRPTGYIIVTKPIHVTDERNLYKGHNLQPGDMITVQLRDDGDYNMLVRRCWTTVPKEYGEYHPFTNWAEAKKGDLIGGGTLFYGLTQGHGSWRNRVYNINKAMGLMDGVIIGVGKKYDYLKNLGPVTAKNGWKKGGIIHIGSTSGGVGTGGGICHTSSLTYFSVISIPVYIYEREPHLDEGANYMPVEFDATVGAWSNFIFYNVLPYDIKQHAFVDKLSGVITVYYECLETKEKEEIDNWDWKSLPLPLAKDDR